MPPKMLVFFTIELIKKKNITDWFESSLIGYFDVVVNYFFSNRAAGV